ncbi:MAG: ROK family transcriptional regulator [Peptoniphilaceae bacterium]|nr:ROK family transcriptional regulator [Peptoniphilaceae bacterium]
MPERINNEVQILTTLYKYPNTSRSDLSQKLRLNKSSISEYTNRLLESSLIRENGTGDSTTKGGRKPICLEINYQYGLCLGIDIAPHKISYALCDLELNLIDYGEHEVEIDKNNVLQVASEIIDAQLSQSHDYQGGLLGITFAIHGIVDKKKIRFTPNYDIYKFDLYHAVSSRYPSIPIHLINESNASALCEAYNSHVRNLVVVNVGSGLGAGIIVEGNLIQGVNGYAGEIGHVIIVPDGIPCNCGNHGCFEQYCSEGAILSYYNSIADTPIKSIEELILEYQQGNSCAEKTIQRDLKYMALLMNHIMKTMAPEIIIINSELAYRINNYTQMLTEMTRTTYKQNIEIIPSIFHHRSVLLGAVYLAIQEFLHNYD